MTKVKVIPYGLPIPKPKFGVRYIPAPEPKLPKRGCYRLRVSSRAVKGKRGRYANSVRSDRYDNVFSVKGIAPRSMEFGGGPSRHERFGRWSSK